MIIQPWLELRFRQEQKDWFFKSGGARRWADDYKGTLFSVKDIEKLNRLENPNQKYYFVEWLAAITLFNRYGLRSLVGSYGSEKLAHKNKVEIIRQRVSDEVREAIMTKVPSSGTKQGGLPDLFVYRHDSTTDWFFAEVKGPTDHIEPRQVEKSDLLDQAAKRKVVRLIEVIAEPRDAFRHPTLQR